MTHRWMSIALVFIVLHLVLSVITHLLSFVPIAIPLWFSFGLLLSALVLVISVIRVINRRVGAVAGARQSLRERYPRHSWLWSTDYWEAYYELVAPHSPRWLFAAAMAAGAYAPPLLIILIFLTFGRGMDISLISMSGYLAWWDLYILTLLYSQWKESTAAVTEKR